MLHPAKQSLASLPSFHSRYPGKRRVNTAHLLSSFRSQTIQKIPHLYSHHNLLEDKLHAYQLAMALHVNYTSINQIFTNAFVLCALQKPLTRATKELPNLLKVFCLLFNTKQKGHAGAERQQYPSGFLLRYCWWNPSHGSLSLPESVVIWP